MKHMMTTPMTLMYSPPNSTWKVRGSVVDTMTNDAERIRTQFDDARCKFNWELIEHHALVTGI